MNLKIVPDVKRGNWKKKYRSSPITKLGVREAGNS